jgi:hypothetical protein
MLQRPCISGRRSPTPVRRAASRFAGQSGQTLIFIVIVLVVLVFVVLAIYDMHHVITQRIRAQNGVDSAALTGAKWQGETLNMVGELNLLKAATVIFMEVPPGLAGGSSAQQTLDSLTEMQRRLLFVGPMLGMLQAEQGAKLNKIRARPHIAQELHDRADMLRRMGDSGAVPQPGYPGWVYDYADMLDAVADAGMAAEFVNSQFAAGWLEFSNPLAAKYLGGQAFYNAVASRDWCYLKELLLDYNYTDYTFWGSLVAHLPPLEGSEYLNLGVTFRSNTWLTGADGSGGVLSSDEISQLRGILDEMASERGINLNPNWSVFQTDEWPAFNYPTSPVPPTVTLVSLTWAVFDPDRWRHFGQDANVPPPSDVLVADIRPEFNYSGADASARVAIEPNITLSLRPRSETGVINPSPPRTDWLPAQYEQPIKQDLDALRRISEQETVVSTAAAKPFGRITLGGRNYRPDTFRVVLPVFETVRLIPLVYSSGGNGFDTSNFNEHRFFHLPQYLALGLDGLTPGCFFCNQLRTWEDPKFRQTGKDWLLRVGCPPPPPPPRWHWPGGGGGGGGPGPIIPEPRPGGVPIAH